jgi:5-methylcytosine-specific restriction endonuclease McrA
MACLKTQKKRVRYRDKHQCQICGEVLPVHYGRLEVHHIDYRCKGGSDELENLVTLCDLCHAVIHDHMGPAWVGLDKFPIEKRDQNKLILDQAREEFESHLRLPIGQRHNIQKELWAQ